MRTIFTFLLVCLSLTMFSQQRVEDDFEGNGTIDAWVQDGSIINASFSNPFKQEINTSNTVLRYEDHGGQFANVNFTISPQFDLSENYTFSIKIYVPSNSITGSQTNQVSLKLQNGSSATPWTTQTEIIKTLNLDTWQTVTFDFKNDNFINFDAGSDIPINRKDFNRVLIQINGEDNTDQVIAYIDDFSYDGTLPEANDGGNNGVDTNFDTLVWSDEFNGTGAVNSSKWFHQTQLPQAGIWYNDEVQHYTDRIENTYQENGNLYLVAKKETFTDQGYTKQYTSARLNSKYAFTYGKVQVRAKLPTGVGTWPAIWMLGKNITEPGGYWAMTHGTTPWPACGEIDIMEHWGKNQNYVSSAMHTTSSHGGTVNHGGQTIPTVSTDFHVYELIWTPEKMVFSVDGNVHYTYNPAVKNEDTWPFDADQYLLLNIAIEAGGTPSTFTESAMVIDYVRVFQESGLSIEDNSLTESDIVVYPNPTNDFLTIKTNIDYTEAVLFDVTGKKVHTIFKTGLNESYDISFLKTGMYFLKVKSNQVSKTLKFIKN